MPTAKKNTIGIGSSRFPVGNKLAIWIGLAILLISIPTSVLVKRGFSEREAKLWVEGQRGHLFYGLKGESPKQPKRNFQFVGNATDYLRVNFGVEFFSNAKVVILDNQFIDDLSPLANFHDLRVLAIYIDILPEANLAVLGEHRTLETLNIDHTSLTAEQAIQLSQLREKNPKLKIKMGHNGVPL